MELVMAKKRGRPRKAEPELRTEQVRVLLTPQEKSIIATAADSEGVGLGEYMRRCTLPKARRAIERAGE